MTGRRWTVLLAVPAVLVGLLSGCSSGGGAGAGSGTAVKAPVEYSAQAFDGSGRVSVADLRGRPVLLSSWATWCEACKDELPAQERFWQAHRSGPLAIVAVNLDTQGESRGASQMARKLGLTMTLWRDRGNAFSTVFRAVGVPTSVLLDSSGRPVRTWAGPVDLTDPQTVRLLTGGSP